MTNYLSADDFLAGITSEAVDVELAGLGVVRVRGLETSEVMRIRNTTKDEIQLSLLTVQAGLLEPKLADAQIEQLAKGKPGIIEKLARRIMELSGLVESEKKADGTGS